MFWLAETLVAAGHDAFPAQSVAEAESLLRRLPGGIDLAIVNPRLPQAARLVKLLKGSVPSPEMLTLEPEPLEFLSRILVTLRHKTQRSLRSREEIEILKVVG